MRATQACLHPERIGHCINVSDIITVHDELLPRGLWKLRKVGELTIGTDSKVQSVAVKIASNGPNSTIIRR